MEKLFETPKEWDKRATREDYLQLQDYFLKHKISEWKDKDCPYGFSYTFAKDRLHKFEQESPKLEENLWNSVANIKGLDIPVGEIAACEHTIVCSDETWRKVESFLSSCGGIDSANIFEGLFAKSFSGVDI